MTSLDLKPLTDRIRAYNPGIDDGLLLRAFTFAEKAHRGQVRRSGEPYFTHPLAVAHILADMHLDSATIITALLHDVVEDTEVTLRQIKQGFTDEIASLVDGVTKLTRIEMKSDNEQAENFRKLVLAMSEDIRVLLVKLADRTHNMRTIDHIGAAKQKRIAEETLAIYAPLAQRIGMTGFQHELEDRAFAVVNPAMRTTILSRLEYLASRSEDLVSGICDELKRVLSESGLESVVMGRRKTAYSIWQKMQRQKVEMEQLSDIMAFRVVVPEVLDCYRALGVLHQRFPMVMGRFKDYISTPKRNQYQSLHTGIIGPNKQKIEVQIRTSEMHAICERGVAAHWSYKGGSYKGGSYKEGGYKGPRGKAVASNDYKQLKWLTDLVKVLENAASSAEFLEHTQMEMYADQVFCFTPKGMLVALPAGASAVDFAYDLHSGLGDTCVGVKINGKLRQLATVLKNGDQVEVLTSDEATPKPEWENFVVTGRAKYSIRRFIRLEKQKEFSRLGRGLVQKAFRQAGEVFDEAKLLPFLISHDIKSDDDLFARVGENSITAESVLRFIHPQVGASGSKASSKKAASKKASKASAKKASASKALPKKGLPKKSSQKKPSLNIKGLVAGMAVHHGQCCHPLPGERIVGITTTGKGLTVHRVDCQTLEKFSSSPELWVDIEWESRHPKSVNARLETVMLNAPGSLAQVTHAIGEMSGNITNIQLLTRNLDFFTFLIDVEVSDIRHLTAIIASLQASTVVDTVERAKS